MPLFDEFRHEYVKLYAPRLDKCIGVYSCVDKGQRFAPGKTVGAQAFSKQFFLTARCLLRPEEGRPVTSIVIDPWVDTQNETTHGKVDKLML